MSEDLTNLYICRHCQVLFNPSEDQARSTIALLLAANKLEELAANCTANDWEVIPEEKTND